MTVTLPDQVLTTSAFSQDGDQVASLSTGGILSWRSASDPGKVIDTVALQAHDLRGGVMSSNGSRVATIDSRGAVQVWDAGSGQPVGAPLTGVNRASSVSLSRDGTTLAVQGTFGDDPKQAVRAWTVGESAWLSAAQPATASGLSASGGSLLIRSTGAPNDPVSIRDAVTDKPIDSVTGCNGVPSLSADDTWLVCAGGPAGVRLVHRIAGHDRTVDLPGPAGATAATASTAGQLAAVAGSAGLSVLDLSDGQPTDVAHVEESLGEVKGLTFDQDGARLAVVTRDGLTVVEVPQD